MFRNFIVDDRIEEKTKRFYNYEDAKIEAERLMKIYLRLNSRVRLNQKDGNFYIYLNKKN